MIQQLVHRGPDQEGVWIDAAAGIGLGHRRLSILDLSDSGRQPMVSGSGRYVIVFNGEVYNFAELRQQLASHGAEFRGGSDTEVLLMAIDAWGVDAALEAATGMFAFALWDRQERHLILARDRLGEKPLYYGWRDGAFWFASELKAIVAAAGTPPVDRDVLLNYLRYGYVPAPWSIYAGLYKLPPGCRLTLTDAKRPGDFAPHAEATAQAPRRYWSVAEAVTRGRRDPLEDPAAAEQELDELLRRTVARQSVADVPVGAFLSGGIDSSTVVAVMQALAQRRVNTFTIGYAETAFDESGFAAEIARHLGTDHQELVIGPGDTLAVVPDLASIYDEPFADASQIPAYLVSRLARRHVTVCLSGDGGDELFAGYNRYFATDRLWRRLGRVPMPLRRVGGGLLGALPPAVWDRFYHHLVGRWREPQARQRGVGLKMQKLAALLGQPSLAAAYRGLLSFWDTPGAMACGGEEPADVLAEPVPAELVQFMDRAMFWDQIGYLPGDNLAKVDRASMAVSLETRLPLLSHEVVAFSWRLPLALKYRDGQSKWLLRQVLYRYVPRRLIERPKMGFSVPVGEWLRGPLYEWGADLLAADRLRNDGFFDAAAVARVWRQHQSGEADFGNGLWTLLMFQAWQDAAISAQHPAPESPATRG